ncbi:MAG: peptidoglycan-binding protein [Clostridiales bacterium]|jgi:peptidoglycan hydrolase-like protein with peptidoglycan-binding domain|nr:peptidoglycan-binding protein [Clostridiales bacterium]
MKRSVYALALAIVLFVSAGGSGSAAVPSFPIVKSGSAGANAAAAQYLLNHRGYRLAVDGKIGVAGADAIRRFQMSGGLVADGIAGQATFAALTETVRRGTRNDAVRAAQYLLKYKHGAAIGVDGIFGAETLAAVKRFQSGAGITADGIVGQITWRYLFGSGGTRTATPADTAIAKAKSLLGATAYNGYCQRFVRICFEAAGITGYAATASAAWGRWGASSSAENIPKGAVVYFDTSSSGHAGIFTGDGYVIHAAQTVKTEPFDAMCAKYRYIGWGYQGGVNPNL